MYIIFVIFFVLCLIIIPIFKKKSRVAVNYFGTGNLTSVYKKDYNIFNLFYILQKLSNNKIIS